MFIDRSSAASHLQGGSAQFEQGTQLVVKLELGECSNKCEDARTVNFSKAREEQAGFFDSHVTGPVSK